MPPKAGAAPVPESVLKKQAATKKSAEDRAKAQAARKQVRELKHNHFRTNLLVLLRRLCLLRGGMSFLGCRADDFAGPEEEAQDHLPVGRQVCEGVPICRAQLDPHASPSARQWQLLH